MVSTRGGGAGGGDVGTRRENTSGLAGGVGCGTHPIWCGCGRRGDRMDGLTGKGDRGASVAVMRPSVITVVARHGEYRDKVVYGGWRGTDVVVSAAHCIMCCLTKITTRLSLQATTKKIRCNF